MLQELIIPADSQLRTIHEYALSNTRLRLLFIPKFTSYVSFFGIFTLRNITIHQQNQYYKFISPFVYSFDMAKLYKCLQGNHSAHLELDNNTYLVDYYSFTQITADTLILPASLRTIHNNAFSFARIKNIDISQCIYVSEISHSSFRDNIFSTFNLSQTKAIEICREAFCNCPNLHTFELSKDIVTISVGAFSHCKKLRKLIIHVDSNLQVVRHESFMYTDIEEFFIPIHLQYIGFKVFTGINNFTFKLHPAGSIIHVIDNVIFGERNSTLIYYPENLPAKVYTVPNHVTALRNWCFFNAKNLQEINFPSTLTKIFQDALSFTSLKKVVLPYGLQTIENTALSNNYYLESADLGESLRLIPKFLFSECVNLKYVYLPPTITYIRQKAFDKCCSLRCICCSPHIRASLATQVPARVIQFYRCNPDEYKIIVI